MTKWWRCYTCKKNKTCSTWDWTGLRHMKKEKEKKLDFEHLSSASAWSTLSWNTLEARAFKYLICGSWIKHRSCYKIGVSTPPVPTFMFDFYWFELWCVKPDAISFHFKWRDGKIYGRANLFLVLRWAKITVLKERKKIPGEVWSSLSRWDPLESSLWRLLESSK